MSRRTVRTVTPRRPASSGPDQRGRPWSSDSSASSRPVVSRSSRCSPSSTIDSLPGRRTASVLLQAYGRCMEIDWTKELVAQLSFQWDNILRPRLDGLTDEQYLWEPVPGMWSVRRRADATTPMAAGTGDTVIDYELPEPLPPPLTSIAWRLGHICVVFGQRAANHFGGGVVWYDTIDWPLTAAGMLELVDH